MSLWRGVVATSGRVRYCAGTMTRRVGARWYCTAPPPIPGPMTYMCVYVCICAYMYEYVRICTYMCVYVRACTWMYAYTSVCTRMHIYMHTYTHTYIHTYKVCLIVYSGRPLVLHYASAHPWAPLTLEMKVLNKKLKNKYKSTDLGDECAIDPFELLVGVNVERAQNVALAIPGKKNNYIYIVCIYIYIVCVCMGERMESTHQMRSGTLSAVTGSSRRSRFEFHTFFFLFHLVLFYLNSTPFRKPIC